MNPKPVALPRPPRAEASAVALTEGVASADLQLKELMHRREAIAFELDLVDAEVERFAIESICGDADDSQDVENYDGSLGITKEYVDEHEPPVGQLQWLEDLAVRFNGSNDSPGDVAGARWGSGGLIGDDVFVTAGHCFDQSGGGWQRPRRNGVTIEPAEIATLMRLNFNYQVDGTSGATRPGVSFPIDELLEFRIGGLDFAIVRAGRNEAGQLPGEAFGVMKVASTDLSASGAMLCLIQHPAGRPKKVEAGPLFQNQVGRISYDSLDTLGGSSGSLILSPDGEVVGVHTNGGCTRFSGANFGVAIGTIRSVSSIIGG